MIKGFWTKLFGNQQKNNDLQSRSEQAAQNAVLTTLAHSRNLAGSTEQAAQNAVLTTLLRYPKQVEDISVFASKDMIESQMDLINDIRQTGFTDEDWQLLVLPGIKNLADYVQLLPASNADHHCDLGGMFRHSLEVAYFAILGDRGMVHDMKVPGALRIKRAALRRVMLFYAGIFHDIGKVFSDIHIYAEKSGRYDVWNPEKGSVFEWALKMPRQAYRFEYISTRNHNEHKLPNSIFVNMIMPDAAIKRLSNERDMLLDLLRVTQNADDQTESARLIAEIVMNADAKSVIKDRKRVPLYRNEITRARAGYENLVAGIKIFLEGKLINVEGAQVFYVKGPEKNLTLVNWNQLSTALEQHLVSVGSSFVGAGHNEWLNTLFQFGYIEASPFGAGEEDVLIRIAPQLEAKKKSDAFVYTCIAIKSPSYFHIALPTAIGATFYGAGDSDVLLTTNSAKSQDGPTDEEILQTIQPKNQVKAEVSPPEETNVVPLQRPAPASKASTNDVDSKAQSEAPDSLKDKQPARSLPAPEDIFGGDLFSAKKKTVTLEPGKLMLGGEQKQQQESGEAAPKQKPKKPQLPAESDAKQKPQNLEVQKGAENSRKPTPPVDDDPFGPAKMPAPAQEENTSKGQADANKDKDHLKGGDAESSVSASSDEPSATEKSASNQVSKEADQLRMEPDSISPAIDLLAQFDDAFKKKPAQKLQAALSEQKTENTKKKGRPKKEGAVPQAPISEMLQVLSQDLKRDENADIAIKPSAKSDGANEAKENSVQEKAESDFQPVQFQSLISYIEDKFEFEGKEIAYEDGYAVFADRELFKMIGSRMGASTLKMFRQMLVSSGVSPAGKGDDIGKIYVYADKMEAQS